MTRRSGITLVEVLVAIFVMGIGLMALLTLFPIGMLRMAQAIRDARSVESAEAAYTISIMQNIRNDLSVNTLSRGEPDHPIADVFKNPYPVVLKDADPYGESYPVMVDPIGYNSAPTNSLSQHWVGASRGLRRRPVAFTDGAALNIYKSFTLCDDINFASAVGAGTPQTVTGTTTVLRDTRYSWAYVYRRPNTSDRAVVECTVVVFDKRSLALSNSLSLAETAYPNTTYFNPNNNTITIHYNPATQPAPAIRPGDWILDNTLVQTATTGTAHAYFYRVVAGEDFVIGGNTYARYEVQQRIRGFVNASTVADPIVASQTAYQGTAIVIEGIADVYEKGPVRMP
jgi:Prokaryotic N-terminal methylation motif